MESVLSGAGLAALEVAVPSHVKQVRRLFVDRLSPEQLDEFASIAGTILDNLRAEKASI